MNNQFFEGSMFYDDLLKRAKQVQKENEQALKRLFNSKIKQSFLIDILHRVESIILPDISKYYDMSINNEKLVSGDMGGIEYEICRMIVGVHRSNCIFITEEERVRFEKDELYKNGLTNSVVEYIKLRDYAAEMFRKKQIVLGDEFLFFPVPYKLFVLCVKSLDILNEYNQYDVLRQFYVSIFNKSLAALTLIEDNFLDNAYPICRLVLELYFKLLLIEIRPELLEEHNAFADYDMKKSCCGQNYTKEFEFKFKNRKDKVSKSKIEFLHYGWLDCLDDYHETVDNKSYSIAGIISYLEKKNYYKKDFSAIKVLYTRCHTYTHGNVEMSKYPLLHYFELSIILGLVLSDVYTMLVEHAKVDNKINEIDVLDSMLVDFNKLIDQYNKKSTENFEAYYNYRK